jgi:hypothetical protein
MDTKNKIFIACTIVLVVASISATYYRIFIEKDYSMKSHVACDPKTESCFVEACDQDVDCSPSYYKIVIKNTKDLYRQCGNIADDCEAASTCSPTEDGCQVIYCNSNESDSDCFKDSK